VQQAFGRGPEQPDEKELLLARREVADLRAHVLDRGELVLDLVAGADELDRATDACVDLPGRHSVAARHELLELVDDDLVAL
jgi:hypothetical protein